MKIRTGFGYDVHRLVPDRPLWLGGIRIEHSLGLLGHSDADVLIHAICDAVLGASGLRDIGFYFLDNSEEFKDIDSKILLARTMKLMREAGYEIGNVDATVIAQRPKISPYIPEMQRTLAAVMQIAEEDITVKATTTEHLGFTGREEGIAACAVALVTRE